MKYLNDIEIIREDKPSVLKGDIWRNEQIKIYDKDDHYYNNPTGALIELSSLYFKSKFIGSNVNYWLGHFESKEYYNYRLNKEINDSNFDLSDLPITKESVDYIIYGKRPEYDFFPFKEQSLDEFKNNEIQYQKLQNIKKAMFALMNDKGIPNIEPNLNMNTHGFIYIKPRPIIQKSILEPVVQNKQKKFFFF